jgi:hypothetical protein
MNIRKVTLELTILYDADTAARPQDMGLAAVIREMDEGDLIGQSRCVSDERVPDEKIEEELFAVGNDGTFFAEKDDGPLPC